MASFLDISLLGYFSNIFVILFIFAASYAVLMFKKPLGDNKGVNALLSATIAIIFIFSQDAIDVIKTTVPWFIVMMIALIFVLIITQSFNASVPETIMANIGSYVLIISVIILLISVSQKIGQSAGPYLGNETVNPDVVQQGGSGDVGSGSFTQNFGATLFHPKVLALLLIIVVSVFAVLWIGYRGI